MGSAMREGQLRAADTPRLHAEVRQRLYASNRTQRGLEQLMRQIRDVAVPATCVPRLDRRPAVSATRAADTDESSSTTPRLHDYTTALRRAASRNHCALSFGMRCCVLKST